MRLSHVSAGWRGLEAAFNRIIDAINANEPIEGSGIRITTSGSSGMLIETAPQGEQPTDAQSGGQMPDGQWIQIVAFDAKANPILLNVWASQDGTKTPSTPLWGSVAILDANCVSTTVVVLEKQSL